MRSEKNEYLPALYNVGAAVIVFLVSFLIDVRISGSIGNFKFIGILIVYFGMAIFVWATIYLKNAINGMVSPRLEYIVTKGPYKYCRHPVYLGITIAFIGLTISLRSWLGCLLVIFLFLPSEIHRAKLEEKALSVYFGDDWKNYVKKTVFFIPFLKKQN